MTGHLEETPMPLEIITADLTKVHADAIVNTANENLLPDSGTSGAVFRRAGYQQLARACEAIGHCDLGQCVVTHAFKLPARYIIHTAGPVWRGGDHQEEQLLRSCYQNSLQVSVDYGCRSVACPLISVGNYGYPERKAIRVALDTIRSFLTVYEMTVYLVLEWPIHIPLRDDLEEKLSRYIEAQYLPAFSSDSPSQGAGKNQMLNQNTGHTQGLFAAYAPVQTVNHRRRLEEMLYQLDEPFSVRLFQYIDRLGLSDVEVYKRANIDRRLFSKIRCGKGYVPHKETILALAISLRLTLSETQDLLKSAGYTLTRSSKLDVIVQYFIEEKRYDIFDVNEALYSFGLRILGSAS